MNKLLESVKKSLRKLWSSKSNFVLAITAVVVSVAGLVWLVQQIYQANLQRIDTSKYQIVYLVNGQAYFGKLQNTSGDFLVVKSAYIAQSVEATNIESDDKTANQTTLLKVTDQVYGPQDSIAIKSSQVAFWQNLRDDSKVVQAIKAKE